MEWQHKEYNLVQWKNCQATGQNIPCHKIYDCHEMQMLCKLQEKKKTSTAMDGFNEAGEWFNILLLPHNRLLWLLVLLQFAFSIEMNCKYSEVAWPLYIISETLHKRPTIKYVLQLKWDLANNYCHIITWIAWMIGNLCNFHLVFTGAFLSSFYSAFEDIMHVDRWKENEM